MNQKLRTSSGIALLLALLGIVCLSFGMFFTVLSFSYAAEGDAEQPAAPTLNAYDESGNALWLVSSDGTDFAPLINGGTFKYLYFDVTGAGDTVIKQSSASELNQYVLFNGNAETEYSVKLNPEYV